MHIHEELKGMSMQAYAELIARQNLAYKMGLSLGLQYGGARDLYNALGYPDDIKYGAFFGKYKRMDIAKAVIDRPIGATWRGLLELEENKKAEETEFEKKWKALRRDLKLKNIFGRVDKLACLGRYAILLLGFDDTPNQEAYLTPVKKGAKLLFLRPYSENTAIFDTFETNTTSARYGQPITYSITTLNTENGQSDTIRVHHTRVLHIALGTLENELIGTPKLEVIYNRLLDLEKIVGGDGEMFWRGARPGYAGNIDKEFGGGAQTEEDIKAQVKDYENGLSRILISEGLKLESLAQQIADPKNHVDIQLAMISAVTGIPKRILIGSERGELSSAQDSSEWRAFVQERREEEVEGGIVRPFVDRMIEMGVLPKPVTGDYKVRWPNAFDLNPKEKSEIGLNRARSLREYTTNGIAQAILPPKAAFEFLFGLDDSEIEYVEKVTEKGMEDEMASWKEYMEFLEDVTPKPEPGTQTMPGRKDTKASSEGKRARLTKPPQK